MIPVIRAAEVSSSVGDVSLVQTRLRRLFSNGSPGGRCSGMDHQKNDQVTYIYIYICMWQGPLESISFIGPERHLLQSTEKHLHPYLHSLQVKA